MVAYNIPEEYDSKSNEDVMNTIPDISIDEDAGEVGTETNFLMGTHLGRLSDLIVIWCSEFV